MSLETILKDLKALAKKDVFWAKETEKKIIEMYKKDKNILNKKNLVKEVYEKLKMEQSIDKSNFFAKQRKINDYVSKESKIGRINRRKAMFDMTWIIKKNAYRLNQKDLMMFVKKIEKELIYPEDFDVMQTAKIRDDFVFLKDGKLHFHTLDNGKEIRKAIKLEDNSLIVLGKNYVFRIKDEEIEDDHINGLGMMPLDSVYYVKDNLVFVLKR